MVDERAEFERLADLLCEASALANDLGLVGVEMLASRAQEMTEEWLDDSGSTHVRVRTRTVVLPWYRWLWNRIREVFHRVGA